MGCGDKGQLFSAEAVGGRKTSGGVGSATFSMRSEEELGKGLSPERALSQKGPFSQKKFDSAKAKTSVNFGLQSGKATPVGLERQQQQNILSETRFFS